MNINTIASGIFHRRALENRLSKDKCFALKVEEIEDLLGMLLQLDAEYKLLNKGPTSQSPLNHLVTKVNSYCASKNGGKPLSGKGSGKALAELRAENQALRDELERLKRST